ncbi:MAG: FHA domain-containing protein [Lachnospiraceae bacterium]|jgi:hypothetical protein|nr:FHA domain-containing protein [Lachnospiraceae bacterium]
MFCTSCGGQIRDEAKFCIYCGAPQKAKTNYNDSQEQSYQDESQFGQVDDWSSQDGDWTEADSQSSFQEGESYDTEPAASGLLVLQDMNNSDNVYACDLGTSAVLGRDKASCTMVIEGDRSVSRRHCSFYRKGNACYVEDLKSFNHTLLNGVAIEEPKEIQVGDRLTLGAVELMVAECDLSQ